MRIVAVARRFPPDVQTGRSIAFARLVAQLRRHHDVQLVAGYRGRRADVPEDALGVDLSNDGPGWTYHALWRAVGAVAARHPPDLVLAASVDVPFLGHPTIGLVRDLVQSGWRAPTTRDRFYRWRARRLGALVVPSVATRQALVGLGVDPWRIHIIGEHVDLPPLTVVPPTTDRFRLVHAGRIHPGKGQHLSIDAVSRLSADEKARVHLEVVGAIADRTYYDQLRVAARGQPVSFAPNVADLGPHLAASELVLYPTSLAEGFADTALQAMALGCPVAWADHPGVRETTGGIGIPLPPDNVDALRAAIRRHIGDPEGLRAMGRASRIRAEKYAWSQVRPAWDALLNTTRR